MLTNYSALDGSHGFRRWTPGQRLTYIPFTNLAKTRKKRRHVFTLHVYTFVRLRLCLSLISPFGFTVGHKISELDDLKY